MKAYQIKNLKEKIAKQEGIVALIEKSASRTNIPAWKVAQLNEKLAKETSVLNYMIATLERAC